MCEDVSDSPISFLRAEDLRWFFPGGGEIDQPRANIKSHVRLFALWLAEKLGNQQKDK